MKNIQEGITVRSNRAGFTFIQIPDGISREIYKFRRELSETLCPVISAAYKNKQLKELYNLKTYTKEEVFGTLQKYAEIFKPYVCFDWRDILRDTKREGKKDFI